MTILGILLLLFLHQMYAALEVFAPSPQWAFVTNDTVLNCTFSVDTKPVNFNFLAVLWSFQEKVILTYDNKGQIKNEDPRMSLRVEALKDGDASLHVSDITINDGGIFKCSVIYSPERKDKEILLNVLAKPLLSILGAKVQRNTVNNLTCKAFGFFPPDIGITWYRNGEVLRNYLIGKPQMYKDGTYQIISTLTIKLMDNDQNQTYSCRVQHYSLEDPLERNFQLTFEDIETSSNVPAVVCIFLIFIVIAFGIGFYFWKKKYRKKEIGVFTVMGIEGPTKLIAGEETSLYCKATNVPENTRVTWLEKRGGQVYEVQNSNGRDLEEEERLMDIQYGIRSWTEGPNDISSLKFTPNVTKHKDVTFICRYDCAKRRKEKTFHCGTIYAKPRLLHPISRNLSIPKVLKYLATLERFYPRDITIRWMQRVGEQQQDLTSKETFTEIPGGTWGVCSEVRIPEDLLKDPKFKVRISWEHKALDTTEYRDLSIADSEYAWTPVIEEIEISNVLHHNIPVTLQCHISEYFPDALTVTWLRRSENQEICEAKDSVASSAIILREGNDNTYSCTASLTIVPTLRVNQGAEYICRVDHPSLRTPIEKKTKKLVVNAIPRMVEPIEITIKNSRIHFTLNLQTFYPKDIKVDWKYEGKDSNMTIPSHSTFKNANDLTYDITSVSHLSPKNFKDPQYKVSVTWNHESMDEPETRTLTAKELPIFPKVGEIIIPELEENKMTTLTCDISECLTDYLTVKWSKKTLILNQTLPNNDYNVFTESQKEKFSSQSSLTFTFLSKRDEGAEFICKVEHPTLDRPVQRTTGPIGLRKLSMNSSTSI